MKISLSSSLHLNHGGMRPDMGGGDPLPMMTFVPVGLLSLKAYADQQALGPEVRVYELNTLINQGKIANDDAFYEHIVDTILDPDDEMVGLMTDADSLHHTIILSQRVKARRPDVKVCLGGPASSPMAARILNTFPTVDYVVRSEGEATFVELIRHLQGNLPASEIHGLSWRDGDRAVDNAPRPLELDLDRIPMPDFAAFDMASGAPLYLDVGRGCPFKCSFCATAPFWKRQYRMKSIERIVAEAVHVRDLYGRKSVNFSHDIFTCDRAWTLEFCDHLIKNPIHMDWTCSTRTDIIDPEVLEKLAEAGCVEIYYGIETGSQEMQQQIDKGLDLDWARKIVQTTADVGIRPVTGFILGYPFETKKTLEDTITRYFQYLEAGGYRAHMFILSPFPESPMYAQYGVPHIDRPAEYYDLNLSEAARQPGERLKKEHLDVFASTYRYKTPEVPASLIDACEELSARVSMLRSLFPHLLVHYGSILDFYTRWVEWIEAYNDRRRPGTLYRHQAEADDLLEFVELEMERLGIKTKVLHDLVRYEKMKLDGRYLSGPKSPPRVGVPLDPETYVEGNTGFLISEFDHDIQALLARRSPDESLANGRRWVVVYKVNDEELATLQVGDHTKAVLDQVQTPVRVGDLLTHLGAEADPEAGLALLQKLAGIGLLSEVRPS